MPQELFSNHAKTRLIDNLSSAETASMLVEDTDNFPTGGGDTFFRVVVVGNCNTKVEVIEITGICTSGEGPGCLSIGQRGVEGTSPTSFDAGDIVYHSLTAGAVDTIIANSSWYLGSFPQSSLADAEAANRGGLRVGMLYFDTTSGEVRIYTGNQPGEGWKNINDEWYLGPSATFPTTDNNGEPLITGNTFLNTTDDTWYSYMAEGFVGPNGDRWGVFGPVPWFLGSYNTGDYPTVDQNGHPIRAGSVIYDLDLKLNYSYDGAVWRGFAPVQSVQSDIAARFVWEGPLTVTNPAGLTWPDSLGQTEPTWTSGETILSVYEAGVLLTPDDSAGSGVTGRYTIDYANNTIIPVAGTPFTLADSNEEIIIRTAVAGVPGSTNFIETTDTDATGWAFKVDVLADDASKLASSKAAFDGDAATLSAANAYTDGEILANISGPSHTDYVNGTVRCVFVDNNTLKVTAGTVISRTSGNPIVLGADFTKQIGSPWVAGSGNNGRHTSPGGRLVHVYLIQDPSGPTVDVFMSSQMNSGYLPAFGSMDGLPAGYTDVELIGVYKETAAGNLIPFTHSGNRINCNEHWTQITDSNLQNDTVDWREVSNGTSGLLPWRCDLDAYVHLNSTDLGNGELATLRIWTHPHPGTRLAPVMDPDVVYPMVYFIDASFRQTFSTTLCSEMGTIYHFWSVLDNVGSPIAPGTMDVNIYYTVHGIYLTPDYGILR